MPPADWFVDSKQVTQSTEYISCEYNMARQVKLKILHFKKVVEYK